MSHKPRVLFITDPLCSWCWGTLPQIEATRRALGAEVEFDLIMGGLQVGSLEGLAEYNKRQLIRLWAEVRQVTGQIFSGRIPENFVYHSEIACRAVEIARAEIGSAPWTFFHSLQRAFYVEGKDITRTDVLASILNLPSDLVEARLSEEQFIETTRENFKLVETLSANALPSIHIDAGDGQKLVCGGYVTAEYLIPELRARLSQGI